MSRTEAKQWMLRMADQGEPGQLEQTVVRMGALYDWLKCDGFVVREGADEDAPHPHFHFYIEGAAKESTLRAKVAFLFGVRGNKEYSLKAMNDPPRYLRYCCKGPMKKSEPQTRQPPMVVFRKGARYTDELFQNEYEAFWTEHATQTAKQSRHVSKESKTQKMVADALEHFRDRCTPEGTFVNPEDGVWNLTHDVIRWIVRRLCSDMGSCQDHWIMGVANTVVCRLSKESEDNYVSHLYKRMRNM